MSAATGAWAAKPAQGVAPSSDQAGGAECRRRGEPAAAPRLHAAVIASRSAPIAAAPQPTTPEPAGDKSATKGHNGTSSLYGPHNRSCAPDSSSCSSSALALSQRTRSAWADASHPGAIGWPGARLLSSKPSSAHAPRLDRRAPRGLSGTVYGLRILPLRAENASLQ